MQKNVNDIILELMPAVETRAKELSGNPDLRISYMAGHIVEICENLQLMSTAENEQYKFPFIGLITDFRERRGYSIDVYSENYLNILIATNTDKDFKAAQRYQTTFKPVLYPIYEALLEIIGDSAYFMGYPGVEIPHTKIDRLYLGREGIYGNEGHTFNDYIDAIEVRDLRVEQQYIPDCLNTNSWQH